jgi:hypothetical protein
MVGAFAPQAAREFFRFEEGLIPVALTPLGYAKGTEPKRRGKPVDVLVSYLD